MSSDSFNNQFSIVSSDLNALNTTKNIYKPLEIFSKHGHVCIFQNSSKNDHFQAKKSTSLESIIVKAFSSNSSPEYYVSNGYRGIKSSLTASYSLLRASSVLCRFRSSHLRKPATLTNFSSFSKVSHHHNLPSCFWNINSITNKHENNPECPPNHPQDHSEVNKVITLFGNYRFGDVFADFSTAT